jgi:hypothetical protein
MATIVVIGRNYWGKGDTVPAAKVEFRKQGGLLKHGYTVLKFGEFSEFKGVDDTGRVYWEGSPPEQEDHAPIA